MTIGQIVSIFLTRFPWIGPTLRKIGKSYLEGAKTSGGGISLTRITEQHLRGMQSFRFPATPDHAHNEDERDKG